MKIKEKIVYNPHTHEIIGFEEGGLNPDVLLKEFQSIGNITEEHKDKPSIANHILLFMFRRWDSKGNAFKRSVARYSVRNSNGESLKRKIRDIIDALSIRGFIVNQIASDGATENVSCMKQLATKYAKDVWPEIPDSMPGKIKVSFEHPHYHDVLVFIGGRCHIGF